MTQEQRVHPAAAFLAKHAWKQSTVVLEDEPHDVSWFDWYALAAEDDAVIAKGQALPEDQQDSYFSHARLWLSAFDEYFAGEDGAELVESGEWLPIAVVDMGNAATMESFAEINNGGFLALVMAGGAVGSVIWYHDDETTVVADSLDELAVELVASE